MRRGPWVHCPLAFTAVLAASAIFAVPGAAWDGEQQAGTVASTPAPLQAAIRVGREPGRTRLVLDLTGVPAYEIRELQAPQRIVIDLKDTILSTPAPAGLFAATPVQALQAEQLEGTGLRLILRMTDADFRREDFLLRPHAQRGHRLVVDIYQAQRTGAATAPESAVVLPSGAVAPVSPREPVQDQAAAQEDEPALAPALPLEAVSSRIADLRFGGYAELAAAYTIADPQRWSRLRARIEVETTGRFDWGGRFKLAGRADGDAAYAVEDDFYPSAVRDNQRDEFMIRETYLDISTDNWEYRLGRQHVVWGEMVGLFLADVVSARDRREFFLQEFETMRIPQWAVRAEHFAGNAHLELLWVPYPSYDQIGKPGADFYPFPLPAGTPVREVTPSRSDLSNHGVGARFSYLAGGWDLSGFFYRSRDVAPTLYRTPDTFELRHDRLHQTGLTFSKDFFSFVFKGEAVYTSGRSFLSADPAARFGVAASDAVDYVVGVMIPRGLWRFDAQFYGRHVFDHDPGMGFDADELGLTLLLNRKVGDRLEAEVLYLAGLNRRDWSLQPSLTWAITQSWRLQLGADLFGGREIGLFGQYDDSDRVFVEIRKWF